ncbi:Gfo/Idh/MocA family oxidoreductase [Phycicoccus sp. BSK3Z-2]|uniref:Gfo/Idh/MocA family oxidoreductase n=1 Tax=Phycicoccus avicenniae TaxID=2828860 RepID=A0A941D4P2_9MICO|nr:Gfo/Idh/MocA family oxidoreductase [Phycicoccus avicenniae]MBR7741835.1 Gfo/Idh/MocA family oxidoreductase [Phycicoccus avicenniae]
MTSGPRPRLADPSAPAGLRVAVLGVGERSSIALHAVEGGTATIVAAVDPDLAARRRSVETFGSGVATFASHRALLESGMPVHAAFVTTPDHTHAEIARDLLEAGVAVYLEKPIATTVEDADAVLETAAATGTSLFVGHNMRYMPVVELMHSIIRRGDIGDVKAVWCRHFVGNGGDYYFKDWHAERSLSTGLLLQKGAHDIDVIHLLAGGTTSRVTAIGDLAVYGDVKDRRINADRRLADWFSLSTWPPQSQRELNPVIDVEDLSMMLMTLDNGVLASYQQCHFTPDYWRNYTVIGTKGRLENFGDTVGGVVKVWTARTTYLADGNAQYPIPGASEGHAEADARAVADFMSSLSCGTSTQASPVSARNAVAAAVAATLSLRHGATPQPVATVSPELSAYFRDATDRDPSQMVQHPFSSRELTDQPRTKECFE